MTVIQPIDAGSTALIRRAYAAFAAGDIPAVLDCFAPDAVFTCHGAPHLPAGGTWRGHAGLTGFFMALGRMAEVLAFSPETITTLPDGRILAEGRERMRFHATGIDTTTRWLHLFVVRDGMIAEGVEWNEGAVLAAAHRGG